MSRYGQDGLPESVDIDWEHTGAGRMDEPIKIDVENDVPDIPPVWDRPAAPSAVEAFSHRSLEEPEPESGLSEAKQDLRKRLQKEEAAVQRAQEAVEDALDWREGRLTTSEDRKRVLVTLREWAEECDRNLKVFDRSNAG